MSSCKSTQRTNVLLLDLVHQKECVIVSGAARSSSLPLQARFHYLSLYKAFLLSLCALASLCYIFKSIALQF